jgi:hypothetical protein
MRQVNSLTVLARHVGTSADHLVPIDDLVPFADGARIKVDVDSLGAG